MGLIDETRTYNKAHKNIGRLAENEHTIPNILKYTVAIIVVLVVQTMTTLGQDCKRLADGRYYFRHKAKGHNRNSDFMLTIVGESYFITRDSKEYPKGKIEWWPDNCMFKLNAEGDEATKKEVTENEDTLSRSRQGDSTIRLQENDPVIALQKTFASYGGYCYEVTNGKKFRLTYCGNVHITSGKGNIIKR